MADEADFASEREQIELERAAAARVRFFGVSLPECEECGADIPEARQRALPGVRVCVECAKVAEQQGRVRRG